MKIKAELRVREGRTVGVLWPVNEEGVPDSAGTKQIEWHFGPVNKDGEPVTGDKVTWHLMIRELMKQPGWSGNLESESAASATLENEE